MTTAAAAPIHDPLFNLPGLRHDPMSGRQPVPLAGMDINVSIQGGLAVVACARVFRNVEATAIEATMTFPVPFDAVLTGLEVEVDGRLLKASAQPRDIARDTYEDGVVRGKLVVLHEEHLRGIHMVSIGQLGPGKSARVVSTYVTSLSFAGALPGLRIPMTVGELYGRSALLPSDDLESSPDIVHTGVLTLSCDCGRATVAGGIVADGKSPFRLDRAIDVAIPNWSARPASGTLADGRRVNVMVSSAGAGAAPLSLALLVDISGSTGSTLGGTDLTINDAVRRDLPEALTTHLLASDEIALYEFDTTGTRLGRAFGGPSCATLARHLRPPQGGTELAGAVSTAIAGDGMRDVLVITDGQTNATEVTLMARKGRRISVILAGDNSLEGRAGDLAGMTGGQVFVVRGGDVATAIGAALGSLRLLSRPAVAGNANQIPEQFDVLRGGARIDVAVLASRNEARADAVGRYAAALCLPSLNEEAEESVSVSHGLVNHLTSLVVVDEVGETHLGLPSQRKVPLMLHAAHSSPSAVFSEHHSVSHESLMDAKRGPLPFYAKSTEDSWQHHAPLRRKNVDRSLPHGADGSSDGFIEEKLHALKGRIDWAKHGPALLREDLSGLDADVWAALLQIAESLGDDQDPFASVGRSYAMRALLALAEFEAGEDRHAARFARAARSTARD